MFYMGQSMKHHAFSSAEYISEKGYQLYRVNPVRIVYINHHTLSITNEDGDGIYYCKVFNRETMEYSYLITDREPTQYNKKNYLLADLYIYQNSEGNYAESN